jgi:hypothetical protein
MNQMQAQYGSRGFQALDLAINGLDDGRNEDQANTLVEFFARNFHAGFPVGWVPKDQFMAFMGFSVMERSVVPQLLFVDRKGYIHYQSPPMGEENSLKEPVIQQRIEELLSLGDSPSAHSPSKSRAATARKGS